MQKFQVGQAVLYTGPNQRFCLKRTFNRYVLRL